MSRRLRFKRNLGRPDVTPTARREELRYVRFEHASEVVLGVRYGPFSYLSDAREVLVGDDEAALEELVSWFDEHLDEPSRMVPFRDVGERRARRRKREALGQCWFREDAAAHIAKARALVAVLERAGIPFVERWSRRLPGKLCSEDGVQVVVVPYRDAYDEG
ncbi:MAG: hypothetical protein JNL38_37125 [Myxococcales bacterium]|nr:hypothetical protein [Myxococcales bacterium]